MSTTSLTETQTVTLERLIDQQINLGLTNPHDCYDALQKQLGYELFELARPYLADFIADMARQKINAQRRSSIAKINPATVADPKIRLRSLWIPSDGGIVYKTISQMTAEDFEARASYLERMLVGLSRHIGWCRSVAAEIRSHDVVTAGQLEHLPPLPEIDDLAE